MTDEEIFETLIGWASTFGCDVYGGEREENEQRRGLFRKVRKLGSEEEMEIVIQNDLVLEERVEVLAHEVSHMALDLLNVRPYQRETHEPTADLLGRCLVAALRGDWENPLLKVGGIVELIKRFSELFKAKIDRTSLNLAMMEQGYLLWKKEQEGMGEGRGLR